MDSFVLPTDALRELYARETRARQARNLLTLQHQLKREALCGDI